MIQTVDELVEVMARAMCRHVEAANPIDYRSIGCRNAEEFVDSHWHNYCPQTSAAILAAQQQGAVMVPVEPDIKMMDAAAYGSKEYRNIVGLRVKHAIAASPLKVEEKDV